MKKVYFPHIDGLRAISVLAVILFHLDIHMFSGGYVGVDIFFVISGFLITRIILNSIDSPSGFSLKNFYIRRFKRLAPALITTLSFTFFFSALLFTPADLKRTSGALLSAVFSTSNIFFWLEADYFDVAAKTKPLLHTWSLSVEEQFYLVWPFLLILFSKLKRFRMLLIFGLSTLSFALNYLFHDGQLALQLSHHLGAAAESFENFKSSLFFLTPFRVFEFGIGALTVQCFKKELKNQLLYDTIFWIGLALILSSCLVYDDTLIFPFWRALAPCLGAALVIYSGKDAYSGFLLSNPLIVYIGVLSYSLYLTHWPIIVFCHQLYGGLSVVTIGCCLLLTLISAILLHTYVEKPLRHIELRKSIPRQAAMIFSIVCLIILAAHSYWHNGWTWRIPETYSQTLTLNGSDAYHRNYYGGEGYVEYKPVASNAAPHLILVGDSHGKHYAEGLVQVISRPNGLVTYFAARASCLHLPGFTRVGGKANFNVLCPKKLKVALDFAKLATERPPTIVMSHSWLSQMKRGALVNKSGQIYKQGLDFEDIKRGILEFKKMVSPSLLIVIGEVPGAKTNLYNHYIRPQLFSYLTNRPDFKMVSPKKHKVEFNEVFAKFAKEHEGIFFINPHKVLCRKNLCRNFDEQGHFMYSDKSHLSKFGSIYFFEKIKNDFLTIIKSGGTEIMKSDK